MPVVAKAMKNAHDIVQYFNKSTQATKKWRISSKSLPCPSIAVNWRTSSRTSRLGGGQCIACWSDYKFFERQSAIMRLTILMTWILRISHMEIMSLGRNHPTNYGILAVHPWEWEVCHWFACPSSNLHYFSIVLASYCIWWKWSSCETTNKDPVEWHWSSLSPNRWGKIEILKRCCCRPWWSLHWDSSCFFWSMHSPLPEEDIECIELYQGMLIINFAMYHHLETLVHILIPTFIYLSSIQLKTNILNKGVLSMPFKFWLQYQHSIFWLWSNSTYQSKWYHAQQFAEQHNIWH